ncbi:DUF6250 domain-containing protein [Puniceicoccus vermicola]|uniref:DUF6250 domain-containing protein n=1 Tax=Puniceicoccus vermicola TaxID=388746 RepID=A0A7X1AZ37_9BACT|nr:DUF6250 domain-containing protein [Puniceicoccus vermicola]MBC2602633.1 hypothetical protein [Puniceicoccus vermicola]
MSHYVSGSEPVDLSTTSLEVDWFAVETFESEDWENRWVVESQGPRAYIEAGELKVRPVDNNRKQAGTTIWMRQALPPDVVIRVTASTAAVEGDNACNLNFFVHAREENGSALQFGRSGLYRDYHSIPNYIFTLTGGFMPGWARARLDPGFHLLSDQRQFRSEPDTDYEFVIVVSGPRLRYFLNGRKVHDFTLDDPLEGGWFGLRTWFSSVNFEQVQIGRLIGETPQG